VLSRLFGLLFHRRVFITLGLIVLALLIWFIGPLFAFADYRPLEPVTVRVWMICILFGLVLLRILVRFWREKRLNARMLDAVLGMRSRKDVPDDPNKPALDALRADFEKALTQMRDARFGGAEGGFWSRLGRRYVYQMPWYVFIGAPGSGKTTALVNSGLRFPLAQSLGKESIRGVGGTRSCDWWFAEEAVLLDTAGRYTTQESNAEADKAEWQGFLGLLKRFRPRQPLNGAILTISVQDLLSSDESERRRHAERLRARLLELTANLGIAFPIYVLVTKADQLGGFNEYFDSLGKEERAQVWGATLALPATPEAGRDDLDVQLAHELEALNRRLFDRLPELLLSELDPARRARAYALPQHFAGIAPLLRELLGEVFAGKRFGPAAMLRGVYFTSGTQDGSSFDRLLGSLQRSLGFDARVALPSQAQSGRSYFLHDLLHKVVLPEAHLAGRNRRAERRERWLGAFGHTAVLTALVLCLLGFSISYRGNLSYIGFVDESTGIVAERLQEIRASVSEGMLPMLPVLGAIERIADGEDFLVEDPPLRLTFGLYQGRKLEAAARTTYRRSLEAVLLPRVMRRIHEVLATAPEEDLEFSYEALRVYLMLNDPQHYDAESVEVFVRADFDRSLPPSLPPSQREALYHHLARLLREGTVAPTEPMDTALVEQVRDRLGGYSLAERGYKRLRRQLIEEPLGEFSIAESAGPKSALVFVRSSGKPITRGIPGLFTHHGYHNVFVPEVRAILDRIEGEETWVLGRAARSSTRQVQDLAEGVVQRDMRRLYLHEYVGLWEEYLADVRIRSSQNIRESRETARILSAPDSPLAQFLNAVARETKLAKPSEDRNNNSSLARLGRTLTTEVNNVERLIGPTNLNPLAQREEQLERIVDDRFEAIHRVVDSGTGTAPIENVLKLFNDLYMGLAQAEAASEARTLSAPPTEVLSRVRSEAAYLPAPLRGMVEGLADSSAAQADGGVRVSLGAEVDSAVGNFCRNALTDRYPFQRSSLQDVTLADFQSLFAPGARFDQFFNSRLAGMADITGPTWQLRQPGGTTVPLTSFQKAARIRDVFFPSGRQNMDLSFEFKVLEMDPSIERLTLDFDGQVFSYAHGPQLSNRVRWPSESGSNSIRVTLGSRAEGERSQTWSGPWALFRLFGEGGLRSTSGPERFIASLHIQGRSVVLEVVANSVQNPFGMREITSFRCPSRI
jgi:type VI secretion system protein ImpL